MCVVYVCYYILYVSVWYVKCVCAVGVIVCISVVCMLCLCCVCNVHMCLWCEWRVSILCENAVLCAELQALGIPVNTGCSLVSAASLLAYRSSKWSPPLLLDQSLGRDSLNHSCFPSLPFFLCALIFLYIYFYPILACL